MQDAVDTTLNDPRIHNFEAFADELAKEHHIEVYRYSKNSNKLGYVLYKEDSNFYDNREAFILLGKNKKSRKAKEQYIERTFSARKLGTDYSFEQIEKRLRENLSQFHYDNIFSSDMDNKQVLALASGVNFETTVYEEEDNEYEIKLHTHVEPQTLRSKNYQKIKVTKNDEKQLYNPTYGFMNAPHTPPAKELHYQISRVMNDDLKMHRAKSDYEFTQRVINNQQQRQRGFEMDY